MADQQKLNSEQSEVLALQAAELRESLAQRRRAQASAVFLEVRYNRGEDGVLHWEAEVSNQGQLPVYEVQVRWYQDTATWWPNLGYRRQVLPRMAPRGTFAWIVELPADSDLDPKVVIPILEFRDANEVWWHVRPDGRLEEVAPPPK